MKMQHDKKKRTSFFLALLLSGILFTIVSLIGRLSVYKGYHTDFWKEPLLTVMFEAAAEGVYPWEVIPASATGEKAEAASVAVSKGTKDYPLAKQESIKSKDELPDKEKKDSDDSDSKEQATVNKKKQGNEDSNPNQTVSKKESKADESETSAQDPSKTELAMGKVEKTYFDDALFIGDSRTVGLSEYSYLKNATYYSDVGLSIYTVFDKKIAKIGKKTVTLEEALEKKQFRKIYIMLGINELGTGTTKTFVAKYQEMLDKIHELQPDAYLIVQSIMNVGKEKSDSDKIFNNKNINERNEGLEQLADGKTIFYLNVNKAVTDDKGYLPDNATHDGIHLFAKYYDEWADYLLENGIQE